MLFFATRRHLRKTDVNNLNSPAGSNGKTPEATKVYARLIVTPVRNAMEEATAAVRKIGEQ